MQLLVAVMHKKKKRLAKSLFYKLGIDVPLCIETDDLLRRENRDALIFKTLDVICDDGI